MNQLNTFPCVAIFIMLKDRNSLITSTKDLSINQLNENFIINLAFFGSDKYHKETNRKILLNCITYLKATTRYDEPLHFSCFCVMCVLICMYINTYICVCIYVYIHVYIYIYYIDIILLLLYVLSMFFSLAF